MTCIAAAMSSLVIEGHSSRDDAPKGRPKCCGAGVDFLNGAGAPRSFLGKPNRDKIGKVRGRSRAFWVLSGYPTTRRDLLGFPCQYLRAKLPSPLLAPFKINGLGGFCGVAGMTRSRNPFPCASPVCLHSVRLAERCTKRVELPPREQRKGAQSSAGLRSCYRYSTERGDKILLAALHAEGHGIWGC